MSKRKYKSFDLIVLCIIAAISEFLSVYLLGVLATTFYISFSLMIAIIALVRWGVIGVITYIVSGVVTFFIRINQPESLDIWQAFLVFIGANIFVIFPYFLIKRDRDIFVTKPGYIVWYVFLSFLSVSIGKGICWIIIYKNVDGFFAFLFSEMLSMFVTIILLWLMAKKTELLVNMDQYLIDQQDEEV